MNKISGFVLLLLILTPKLKAENGYELWLRYQKIDNPAQAKMVHDLLQEIKITNLTPTSYIIQQELVRAGNGLSGISPRFTANSNFDKGLIIAMNQEEIPSDAPAIKSKLNELGLEGYIITYLDRKNKNVLIIAANSPIGALYGTFHLLRILSIDAQLGTSMIVESPSVAVRILNHWDNLDRTVERGYAGFSIWDWHKLPGYIDQRYIDYARANASIGINGTVLTNVNANAFVLTPQYIEKVAALADVFRPYGIRVYLTARFSAPIEIGNLNTADPLDPEVKEWWNRKVEEIYKYIPDFGGFLVKANSEGQPGPQNYGRTHAEGANMLADALNSFGGIVMWRAFVYSDESPEDRAKQANIEFVPLDGEFRDNVVIQAKNGAIDFQPREPFHPLFGAMPGTSLALELQITQEYLGQATSLAYLAPMYKECLDSKTFRPLNNSTVADIVDGNAYGNKLTVMAGVSNIGNDINWTGHPFAQANWYAFGRLAWDNSLSSETIAEEWLGMTFNNRKEFTDPIKQLMLRSHETIVNYMTPLGLHHIMGRNHHYGPGPWVTGGRADWTSPYYHKASANGIGFNRTSTGSDALSQYAKEIESSFSDPNTCPEIYLLWFHHLPWNFKMKSGRILWEDLCYRYDLGVKQVSEMEVIWAKQKEYIDSQRFEQVSQLLEIQYNEARWWKDACLLYFQQFSQLDFPDYIETPHGDLNEYMKMQFPYAPGIKPSW